MLQSNVVWVIHWRVLHGRTPRQIEINPQKSPLALTRVRHTLNHANVYGDKCGLRVWNQYSEVFHVDKDLARPDTRGKFSGGFIGDHFVHLLHFFGHLSNLDFTLVKSNFQLLLLLDMQFILIVFSLFDFRHLLSIVVVFGPQARGGHQTLLSDFVGTFRKAVLIVIVLCLFFTRIIFLLFVLTISSTFRSVFSVLFDFFVLFLRI